MPLKNIFHPEPSSHGKGEGKTKKEGEEERKKRGIREGFLQDRVCVCVSSSHLMVGCILVEHFFFFLCVCAEKSFTL